MSNCFKSTLLIPHVLHRVFIPYIKYSQLYKLECIDLLWAYKGSLISIMSNNLDKKLGLIWVSTFAKVISRQHQLAKRKYLKDVL